MKSFFAITIDVFYFPSYQDIAPVKVEWMPDHNLLPRGNRIKSNDVVLMDNIDHVAPMDVSNDGAEDAFSKAFFSEQVDDIDAEDLDNPQLVSIYVNSIYSYMRKLEVSGITLLIIYLQTFSFHFLGVYIYFFQLE